MAAKTWRGGTTGVKQVDTMTAADTWATSDTLTTTLTSENGSTQTVVSTATGSTIETNVIDVHIADLLADTQSLFTQITWAKASAATITGTAKIAGIPFYCAGSETTAGDGSYSRASTTANAGPRDWNTAANWSAAAVPVNDTDSVLIQPHDTDEDALGNPISYSILYGLDQSAVDVIGFNVPKAFKGSVGDPIAGNYLKIDCAFGSDPPTVINTGGSGVWLEGVFDNLTINGGRGLGDRFMRFKGTYTTTRILDGNISGIIKFMDGVAITTLEGHGCGGAIVEVGTGSGITTFDVDSGNWTTSQAITTANLGAFLKLKHTTGAVTTIHNRGARVEYNSSGTLGTLNNRLGFFDLSRNTAASVTVTNATIWSGILTDRGGAGNVTYTNNILVRGGNVNTETGATVDYI